MYRLLRTRVEVEPEGEPSDTEATPHWQSASPHDDFSRNRCLPLPVALFNRFLSPCDRWWLSSGMSKPGPEVAVGTIWSPRTDLWGIGRGGDVVEVPRGGSLLATTRWLSSSEPTINPYTSCVFPATGSGLSAMASWTALAFGSLQFLARWPGLLQLWHLRWPGATGGCLHSAAVCPSRLQLAHFTLEPGSRFSPSARTPVLVGLRGRPPG